MKLSLLLVALAVSAVAGLAACVPPRTNYPRATRTAAPTIPPYPAAQGVQVRVEQRANNQPGYPTHITTFQTADPPEAVIRFYRDGLTKQGWTVRGQIDQRFLLLTNREACPLYGLEINVQPAGTGATDVEWKLTGSRCGD